MIDYFSFIRQPILSASGCWAQTETQITQLLSTGLGAVCLKSCTLEAKSGNPQPNYYQLEHLSFNSKGLPNPGYPFFKAILLEHHLKHNHTLIFSIAFENTEILEHLLDDLNHCKLRPIFVEINLSCPNLDHDGLSGYNLIVIKKILMLLNIKAYQNLVIGFKCPPYLDKVMIHKMSLLINRYQSIQFITISNSIPNTICFHQGEVVLSTTFGGMSGSFNKYINLGVISLFRAYLKQKPLNYLVVVAFQILMMF